MTAIDDALRVPPASPAIEHERVRSNLLASMFQKPAAPLRVGRFIIESRIGGGGQGDVYRGWDPELQRPVAVKVMRHGVEVAGREARTLARLSHPQLVPVFEWGSLETAGRMKVGYVVSEFVPGQNLGEWLAQKPSRTKRLDVLLAAARGLQAAHDQGVVHGDFKPSNVMVGDDGRARVIDFGIARLCTSSSSALEGSEATAGEKRSDVDQHALCLVVKQALRGSVRTSRLRRVLERGMSRDHERRFDSLQPIIAALEVESAATVSRSWSIRFGSLAMLIAASALVGVASERVPEALVDHSSADADTMTRARQALQQADRAADDGDLDEALAILGEALRDGHDVPSDLAAELLLSRGEIAVRAGQIDHAERWLQDATWQASLAGATEVEANSALELAILHAHHRSDVRAAKRWLERARAAAIEADDRSLTRTLRRNEADVARAAGEFDTARQLLDELEADREAPDHHLVLRARCILEHTATEGEVAVEACRRASEAYTRALGPSHRQTLFQNQSLAAALESAGRFVEARDIILATLEAQRDGPALGVAYTLNSLGIIYEQLGEMPAADAAYEDALQHLERAVASGEPGRETTATSQLREALELNLGTLALERQEPVEAERRYQRVIISLQSRREDPGVALVHALWGLGAALQDQGRHREAVTPLEEALALGDAQQLGLSKLAPIRVALARVLIEADIDRSRGRAQARQAARDLQVHAPELEELLADARTLAR